MQKCGIWFESFPDLEKYEKFVCLFVYLFKIIALYCFLKSKI